LWQLSRVLAGQAGGGAVTFHKATMEIKVPIGFYEVRNPMDWIREFRNKDGLYIFVGKRPIGWYLGFGREGRGPEWEEMRRLRFKLLPAELMMVIVCPPKSENDKLHPNLIHRHEARVVDSIYHVNK
jgi:hypothetical protein